MRLLHEHGRFTDWPVDVRTKQGQTIIKEIVFNMVAELFEATFTLKNRQHRGTDDTVVDMEYFKEELADAHAFFIELQIVCGFSAQDVFDQFVRKNAIVTERLMKGY